MKLDVWNDDEHVQWHADAEISFFVLCHVVESTPIIRTSLVDPSPQKGKVVWEPFLEDHPT